MAKHSVVEYVGDGVQDTFAVNFTGGYMEEDHVTVQIAAEPGFRAITFISPGVMQIGGTVPAMGEAIVFRRTTPVDAAINDFSAGALFSSAGLDASFDQSIKSLQETQDGVGDLTAADEAVEIAEAAATAAAGSAGTAATDAQRAEDAAEALVGFDPAEYAKLDDAEFTADVEINDLTVGRGAGDVSTNTVLGVDALFSSTTGGNNVASGYRALNKNTTGYGNVAIGKDSLFNNTTGILNSALGVETLLLNTTGARNTAVGGGALKTNTTGSSNTASGREALLLNTTGSENTANGVSALGSNTTGADNTASGFKALYSNTTGSNNTASGIYALEKNTTGSFNTSVGKWAGFANTTGSKNTTLGYQADVVSATADHQIAIRAGPTKWYSAAGSPEGTVAAGVGSIYTDSTGSAGAILYIKESGTGNTGWVAH
jgi:hypothetical protein